MPAHTNRSLTTATIIRKMQIFGVMSLLLCVISMFALFAGWISGGALALLLMEQQEMK